jgi:hypothetical protein
MSFVILAAVPLILFTGPDGQIIEVNPYTVASIRSIRGEGHIAPVIKCNIFTTDGKNIAVTETCTEVHNKLQQAKENNK